MDRSRRVDTPRWILGGVGTYRHEGGVEWARVDGWHVDEERPVTTSLSRMCSVCPRSSRSASRPSAHSFYLVTVRSPSTSHSRGKPPAPEITSGCTVLPRSLLVGSTFLVNRGSGTPSLPPPYRHLLFFPGSHLGHLRPSCSWTPPTLDFGRLKHSGPFPRPRMR